MWKNFQKIYKNEYVNINLDIKSEIIWYTDKIELKYTLKVYELW